MESDLSPDVKFFKDFKKQWPSIDQSLPINILPDDIPFKSQSLRVLTSLLEEDNAKKCFRGDYKEILELALVLLGNKPEAFHWKKPGATHKARFLNFGIYILKSFAFHEQLAVDNDFLQSLTRLTKFFATIYVPYFLSS